MCKCCVNCFDEEKIIAFIEKHANIGVCSYCDSSGVYTMDAAQLGDFYQRLD